MTTRHHTHYTHVMTQARHTSDYTYVVVTPPLVQRRVAKVVPVGVPIKGKLLLVTHLMIPHRTFLENARHNNNRIHKHGKVQYTTTLTEHTTSILTATTGSTVSVWILSCTTQHNTSPNEGLVDHTPGHRGWICRRFHRVAHCRTSHSSFPVCCSHSKHREQTWQLEKEGTGEGRGGRGGGDGRKRRKIGEGEEGREMREKG